jgi:DNA primase small subunit
MTVNILLLTVDESVDGKRLQRKTKFMSPPPLGTDGETMEVENVYAAGSSSSNKKSNENETTTNATTGGAAAAADDAVLFSPQLLQMYYKRLFPFSFLYDWLSYGGCAAAPTAAGSGGGNSNNNKNCPAIFSRREFSFTIDANGQEIYIRYQSFQSQKELEQAIIKRCPNKIDIGAVFSLVPKDKNSVQASSGNNAFQPVQRELVFDIDLTDYDEIRKCGCSGARICHTCWGFMQMAVCVMDQGLRQDFGWTHIAWFYSGRRGVHAWVCDESARQLTDQGRSAVAKYF